MALDPGRRIGAYEIVGPLGSGGMGEVYRAKDTRLGRRVAIKLVSGEVATDRTAHERLEREARLTSSLNHPNIVTVYDIGEVDGHPFIVMELVDGETLHARLARGRLKPKAVVDIAAQVAEGLAAAHRAGVVHRDLKPRNVMITTDGRAKILDFGLGKLALPAASPNDPTVRSPDLTDSHAIIGTAGYMAPEQVTGGRLDHRTDQFALGAILYEMLTGQRAFRRDSPIQTMAAVADDEPESLLDLCPDTPDDLATVVSRCLSKDPGGRYASTEDLARDLRDAASGLTAGHSTHSSRRSRVRPRRRRNLLGAAGVALAAVAVVTVLWDRSSPLDEARALLARYDQAENVDRARELLETAVAENPSDVALRASLSEAYWRQYEHTSDVSLIDRAGAESAAALQIDDQYAPVHVVLAMINSKQGRYNGAVSEASRAVALDPGNSSAHRELGRAYLGLGRMEEAEEAFIKAVRLAPDDWTAHNNLGAYYYRIGRLDQAAEEFRKVLDLSPGNTKAYTNLGGVLQRLGRLDEAAALLESSVSLFRTADAFSNLGSIYYRQGQYGAAARTFERAVGLPDAGFRHWRNLAAAAYWAEGMRDRAMDAFAQAVELGEAERRINPKDAGILSELAAAYAVLGRTSEALEILTELDRAGPAEATVLFTMASTYEEIGDRDHAFAYLDRAVEAGLAAEDIERSPWLAGLRQDQRYVSRYR